MEKAMEKANSNKNELIQCVVRQTNLTETAAEKLLEENNNDLIKAIKQYYGLKDKKEVIQEKVSVNQQIYKEIRTLMDTASKNHREKQETQQTQQTNDNNE